MVSDTTQLILAVVRGVLVAAVLYFFGERFNRLVNSIPPRYKLLYRLQKQDRKLREWIVEYYWLVGLLVFTTNILILFLLGTYS
jgi:hypothetical protein